MAGKSQTTMESQLEPERKQVIKALTDHQEFIKKVVPPKTLLFQKLILEVNDVSEKFVQLQVWRNRYNKSTVSGNPMNTFLTAFSSIDHQIQQLVKSYATFDTKLTNTSLALQAYLHCIDVQYGFTLESIDLANKATSLQQLKTVRTPQLEWFQVLPNPNVQELADEWKRLELESNLTQCFREMQAIIQLIASNGDL